MKRLRNIKTNIPNFIPAVIETMGGIGMQLKMLLKDCAGRIATRRSMPYSVVMHRTRQRFVSKLMQYNVGMVLDSMRRSL